jgi:hypothetical protein
MKKIGKRALKTLSIETTEKGFTVWITEKIGNVEVKHWLLDGSLVKETCRIELGKQHF